MTVSNDVYELINSLLDTKVTIERPSKIKIILESFEANKMEVTSIFGIPQSIETLVQLEEYFCGVLCAVIASTYLSPAVSTRDLLILRKTAMSATADWDSTGNTQMSIKTLIDRFLSTRDNLANVATAELFRIAKESQAPLPKPTTLVPKDLIDVLLSVHNGRVEAANAAVSTILGFSLAGKRTPFECTLETLVADMLGGGLGEEHQVNLRTQIDDIGQARAVYDVIVGKGQGVHRPAPCGLSEPVGEAEMKAALEKAQGLNLSLLPMTAHFWPESVVGAGPFDDDDLEFAETPAGDGIMCMRDALNTAKTVFRGFASDRDFTPLLSAGEVVVSIPGHGRFKATPAQVVVLEFFQTEGGDGDTDMGGEQQLVEVTVMELMSTMGVWDEDAVKENLMFWVRKGVLRVETNASGEEVYVEEPPPVVESSGDTAQSANHADTGCESESDNDVTTPSHHFEPPGTTYPLLRAQAAVRAVVKAHPGADLRRLQLLLQRYLKSPKWDWDRAGVGALVDEMVSEGSLVRLQGGGLAYPEAA